MSHKQITITEKETISPVMHVMRCPECGRIVASASSISGLPKWATCEGVKTVREAAKHFGDLYEDEILAGENITADTINEWWVATRDQYPDDITEAQVEKEIFTLMDLMRHAHETL